MTRSLWVYFIDCFMRLGNSCAICSLLGLLHSLFYALGDHSIVYEEEILAGGQQPAPQYQNLIIQHMDIAEPLSTLKSLLESRLQCSLADHQFFLQDSIEVGVHVHRD